MKLFKLALAVLILDIFIASCSNKPEEESARTDTAVVAMPEPTMAPDAAMSAEVKSMDTANSSASAGSGDAEVGSDMGSSTSSTSMSSNTRSTSSSGSMRSGNTSSGKSVGTATSGTRSGTSSTGSNPSMNTPSNTNRRTWAGDEERSIRESTTESQSSVGGATHPTNIPDRGLNSPR